MSEYLIHLAILSGMYFILAQSFNVVFGLAGMFNLAHIASYAVGAYTTALLSTELNQPLWTCISASMTLSAFFALLIGAISVKLSHDHFALGTLAFSSIVAALLVNWKSLTRGVLGIPGVPRPELLGIDFYDNRWFLAFVVVLDALTLLALLALFRSRFARTLRAISEDPYAAQAIGKNPRAAKRDSFIVSSLFAGMAGSVFAYYLNYIDPSSFGLHEMVFVLSIVIVGQPGSFWGVTLATLFLVLLPEPLRFLELSPSILGPMRQLLYALILFAVLYLRRDKLFPIERKI